MRDILWDRVDAAESVRKDIWRLVSPSSAIETDVLPIAAGVLGLSRQDQRFLTALHLLLAPQTGALIRAAPDLLRHLTTSTTAPLVEHPGQVRGPIDWSATLARSATLGRRFAYSTRPVERDYSTPENRLLIASLAQVRTAFEALDWSHATRGVGLDLMRCAEEAERLLGSPTVRNVIERPRQGDRLRVERGRSARRFSPVTRFWRLSERLHRLDDRDLLRSMVEKSALVASEDGALAEAITLLKILDALTRLGWARDSIGLVKGHVTIEHYKHGQSLRVTYQGVPQDFPSKYKDILGAHGLIKSRLRPDIALDWHDADRSLRRTGLVEVKLRGRAVDGARAALVDSLAYREDFRRAPTELWSLGTFWGAGLRPASSSNVILFSVDYVNEAIELFLSKPSTSLPLP